MRPGEGRGFDSLVGEAKQKICARECKLFMKHVHVICLRGELSLEPNETIELNELRAD